MNDLEIILGIVSKLGGDDYTVSREKLVSSTVLTYFCNCISLLSRVHTRNHFPSFHKRWQVMLFWLYSFFWPVSRNVSWISSLRGGWLARGGRGCVTPGSSLIDAACNSRFCPAGSSWKVCMVTGRFPPSVQVTILLVILFKKYFAEKLYEAVGKLNRRIDFLTRWQSKTRWKNTFKRSSKICFFLFTGLLNQLCLDFYVGW